MAWPRRSNSLRFLLLGLLPITAGFTPSSLSRTSIRHGPLFQGESAVTAEDTIGMPYDENLLYMGITEELDLLPKGQSLFKPVDYVVGSSGTSSQKNPRTIEIQKLSQRPPLFHISRALSASECQQIRDWASQQELQQAETRMGGTDSGAFRQNSFMTWVNNTQHHHPGLHTLASQIQSIFLPFEPPLAGTTEHNNNHNHNNNGVEELQVVQYTASGQYKLHHDGALRLLTVLYYLNGVADTWFPLADFTHPDTGLPRRMRGRMEALHVAAAAAGDNNKDTTTTTETETKGIRVTSQLIQPGDAIAFYNYFQDGTVEWNAIHAGLPAESEKWIATHWYHHVRRTRQ